MYIKPLGNIEWVHLPSNVAQSHPVIEVDTVSTDNKVLDRVVSKLDDDGTLIYLQVFLYTTQI